MRRIWHYDKTTLCLVEGPAPVTVTNRAPAVWGFKAFVSQATGRVINDNAQLREDLKVSGCRVKEPDERLNMPPVNPSNRHDQKYDPDFSKEWYRRRAEAVKPEPESPAVQALINAMPPMPGVRVYGDASELHVNPHEVDPK